MILIPSLYETAEVKDERNTLMEMSTEIIQKLLDKYHFIRMKWKEIKEVYKTAQHTLKEGNNSESYLQTGLT